MEQDRVLTITERNRLMADQYDSRVDVLYVYEYLHDALDQDHEYLAQQISDLMTSMAKAFKSDTGITVGEALGWNKPYTGAQR